MLSASASRRKNAGTSRPICNPISVKTKAPIANVAVSQTTLERTRVRADAVRSGVRDATAPAATTARTPDALICSASRYAANGVSNDTVLTATESVTKGRSFLTIQPMASPTASPPMLMRTKAPAAQASENDPNCSGTHCHAVRHERGRVVEESFSLQYRDQTRRQTQPAHDLSGYVSVGRSDNGAENEGRRPREFEEQAREPPPQQPRSSPAPALRRGERSGARSFEYLEASWSTAAL